MMHSIDSRGTDLRTFDTSANDLYDHYRGRFESGGGLASRDIQRLTLLAQRLGREVAAWKGAVNELEGGAAGKIEPRRAGRLLIEGVFDAVLIPEATRLLAAALDLACPQ